MRTEANSKFQLFDDPLLMYNTMLDDIKNARDYIILEIYRFNDDSIGIKFRDAIAKKCEEGVKVTMLLDSWGTPGSTTFFANIINKGGNIRFFKKIKFTFDFFTKNHRRNHRKLLIIDDKISYIGSANLTAYSLNWKELVLKINGDIALTFKKIFEENYKRYNKYSYQKIPYSKAVRYKDYEIVRDAPSISRQRIKKRYEELIKKANREVIIETPYFLPGYVLRRVLIDAVVRGVRVRVLIPYHSDMRLVDILRNKYLGNLHKNGIEFLMYKPSNLHAKMLMIDNIIFAIGSANFDYRSFRYMYEITLIGRDKDIIKAIKNHIQENINNCIPFNYDQWLHRPRIEKLFEWLLIPFRHLF